MGVWTYEGLCLPEQGFEEDFLNIGDPANTDFVGATDMVAKAAGVDIPGNVNGTFEFEGYPWRDPETVAQARRDLGREYPPVFRVRIHVEAEECSAEETAEYWAKFRKYQVGGES